MKDLSLFVIRGSHSSVMEVFWDVMLCRWVSLGTLDPEDEDSRILRNIWAVQSQQHNMTSRKNFKYSTEIVSEKSAEGNIFI